MIAFRSVLSLGLATIVGVVGVRLWPFPSDHPLLGLIAVQRPGIYMVFVYAYATAWFTTPYLIINVASSFAYIFLARADRTVRSAPLPPYPRPEQRGDLFLILGEQHRRTSVLPAAQPQWLTIPERGLYTGIAIIGAIGTGKTSACMYPYVEQLVGYRASDPTRKVGGLILEVKGDFCAHVRTLLERYGRGDDYIEVSLESTYRYNPLHNDLDAYALAYGIATLMTNLFGRGKEPFWQQASTNLVKFVILLHQVLDDYVTLFQVYEHVISPDKLRTKIADGARRFDDPQHRRIIMHRREHLLSDAPATWMWHDAEDRDYQWTHWAHDAEEALAAAKIPFRVERVRIDDREAEKAAQFEAVRRWFDDDWMRIEPKLRTSIVEGVSVFLSLFDDNPRVKHTFCPPKETYDTASNPDGRHGVPLPPLAELIAEGKVVALNFPIAMNPGLARALGTMLKQDFQRAVLNRIHKMDRTSASRRPVFFVCDEYQAFATTGENEPSGDEKFFSLARQARCIPIVATQSISSLRSTLPGEAWRTLLQGLRTKIFLALSDDFSAQIAADLCGKAERLKPGYTLTEAGQDARVSILTGRPAAHRTTVSAAKTYSLSMEHVFQPKAFSELQNAQAIVLPYDGLNPLPPTRCYLKPYYLNPQVSYFDAVAAGAL